jgi:hypothetical protein
MKVAEIWRCPESSAITRQPSAGLTASSLTPHRQVDYTGEKGASLESRRKKLRSDQGFSRAKKNTHSQNL